MKRISMGLLALATLAMMGCATPPPGQIETYVDEPIDFTKRARLVNGPEGARLIFPDRLLFDTGVSVLKSDSAKSLDDCMFIIERARSDVIVEGHTDSTGTRAGNDKLSVDRAEAVKIALIQRKIAPSRIKTRGLADTKPEVQNASSAAELAQNRRAEVIFKGETAESLNATWGCGGPPAKRKVMIDAPKPEPTLLQKVRDDVKKAVEKVSDSK